jgi:hypothetical protein
MSLGIWREHMVGETRMTAKSVRCTENRCAGFMYHPLDAGEHKAAGKVSVQEYELLEEGAG